MKLLFDTGKYCDSKSQRTIKDLVFQLYATVARSLFLFYRRFLQPQPPKNRYKIAYKTNQR